MGQEKAPNLQQLFDDLLSSMQQEGLQRHAKETIVVLHTIEMKKDQWWCCWWWCQKSPGALVVVCQHFGRRLATNTEKEDVQGG